MAFVRRKSDRRRDNGRTAQNMMDDGLRLNVVNVSLREHGRAAAAVTAMAELVSSFDDEVILPILSVAVATTTNGRRRRLGARIVCCTAQPVSTVHDPHLHRFIAYEHTDRCYRYAPASPSLYLHTVEAIL
jgi:hypothetical protein